MTRWGHCWHTVRNVSLRQFLFPQNSPRSYPLSGPVLRDTARLSQRYPPIARYGVFGVSTWPSGCDTPSPFSERFPLGVHAKKRCNTPPPLKRGISAILARYPMKTRQMGAKPPFAILSRKGIARYRGVSRAGPLRLPSPLERSFGTMSYGSHFSGENNQREKAPRKILRKRKIVS